jgi:hypothetical protein
MNTTPRRFETAAGRAPGLWLLVLLVTLSAGCGRLLAQEQQKRKGPAISLAAAEVVTQFLGHLGKANVDAALGLWDPKAANEKLKPRLDKMAVKLKTIGGIKKIDAGPCEERRVKRFEEQTGEKIDVVPVEIVCGDDQLILAVFSIRNRDGAPRIFLLESLKEWGGTASLDDELKYSN